MEDIRHTAVNDALWVALEALLAAAVDAGLDREQLVRAAKREAATGLSANAVQAPEFIELAVLRRHIGPKI
ncbi:hypothetical protein LJR232_003750 [Aquipseudomonas alcaligenes]